MKRFLCRCIVFAAIPTVIEAIRKDFILYKLNVDDSTGQQWCKDFSVYNFPTMLFIKPGSKEIPRAVFSEGSPVSLKKLVLPGAAPEL